MEFTHFNEEGHAKMVDVSDKGENHRSAAAAGTVKMSDATLEAIRSGGVYKGDVLAVAQVAAIQAAKKTWELIPMCHPLLISGVDIRFALRDGAVDILTLLVKTGLCTSRGDARRNVEQGGVTAGDEKVTDIGKTFPKDAFAGGLVLRRGSI